MPSERTRLVGAVNDSRTGAREKCKMSLGASCVAKVRKLLNRKKTLKKPLMAKVRTDVAANQLYSVGFLTLRVENKETRKENL